MKEEKVQRKWRGLLPNVEVGGDFIILQTVDVQSDQNNLSLAGWAGGRI
jgi:hypothetical protein